jgi:hypothetical protein
MNNYICGDNPAQEHGYFFSEHKKYLRVIDEMREISKKYNITILFSHQIDFSEEEYF